MVRKKMRIVSFVLTFLLVFGLTTGFAPANAFADEETEVTVEVNEEGSEEGIGESEDVVDAEESIEIVGVADEDEIIDIVDNTEDESGTPNESNSSNTDNTINEDAEDESETPNETNSSNTDNAINEDAVDESGTPIEANSSNADITINEAAAVNGHVLINQAFGGGGSATKTYKYCFVELYNPTDGAVDMTGWTVQYANAGGNFTSVSSAFPSGSIIQPGGYFLIQLGASHANSGARDSEFPTPDVNGGGSVNIAAAVNKVVLANSATQAAYTGTGDIGGAASWSTTNVVDFISCNKATIYYGTMNTLAPTATSSLIRKTDGDGHPINTDDHNADLEILNLATGRVPRNSAYGRQVTQVAAPAVDPAGGATVADGTLITLSSSTPDADIFYTIDGTEPSASSTLYTAPFALSFGAQSSVTVKAIAVKSGLDNSNVTEFTYNKISSITPIAQTKPSDMLGKTVTVEGTATYMFGTNNLLIQDGNGPLDGLVVFTTAHSDKVGKKIQVTGTLSVYFGITQIAPTTITVIDDSPAAVSPNLVTINDFNTDRYLAVLCKLENVQITARNAATTVQNHTIKDINGETLTLRAPLPVEYVVGDWITLDKCFGNGADNGKQVSCNAADILRGVDPNPPGPVTQVAAPTANPAGGATVADGTLITLSSSTPDADIFYTIDGTEPSASSTLYTAPFALSFGTLNSVTVKAIAVKDGLDDSDVTEFIYTKPSSVIPIAQTKPSDMLGKTVTVEGTATYMFGSNNLLIQDGNGPLDGLVVFTTAHNDKIGKKIQVTGTLSVYFGITQIAPTTITVIDDSPAAVTPNLVTINDFNTNRYLAVLCKLENVQITARNAATTVQNHTIKDINGETLTLRAPLPAEYAVGDWITLDKCFGNGADNGKQVSCNAVDIIQGIEPLPPGEREKISEWISTATASSVTVPFEAQAGVYSTDSSISVSSGVFNTTAGSSSIWYALSATPASWQFKLKSTSYKNVIISFKTYGTTVTNGWEVKYSTDGITYNSFSPSITYNSTATSVDTANAHSFALPAVVNNQEVLYIRLVPSATTGNTRLVMPITVTGEYILGENELRRSVSDTPSGEVPIGHIVNFMPDKYDNGVAGYAIKVSTDSGATWSTAQDNKYTVETLPLTIQVKATAPNKTDSRVDIYTYTQAKMPQVTSTKNMGAVLPGTTIKLENEVPDAVIHYTINGEAEQIFSDPIILANELFVGDPATITIETWATKAGYIDGDKGTYAYTRQVAGGEKVYFGQLHSHTTNSDGAGTLEEAYTYARDIAGLDFFAVTDHSNSFDETGAAGDKAGTYNLREYNVNSTKWKAGLDAASDAFREGEFISVYGYEMTWSGGPGHMNTFNTTGFVSRNNTELNSKTNDAGLRAYYELLKATPESISMFNHPGTTFGNFSNFAYYDAVIDQRISLLEVGNGEGAIGSGGYFPSYEQYTLALDKGWHVAPTNNQDNHLRKWGNANTARTAIYTNDLSIDGVYQALRDMHVYATEVPDLEIVYKVNGLPLGTILDVVPSTANFTAEIKNPTTGNSIKSVSLITNGGVELLKDTLNTQNYTYNKTITSPAAGYYYLKVVVSTPQGDRIAVTAPVWLGSGKAAGFTEVTKSTIMPVTTEELGLTAGFFNNEKQAATLQSIEYKTQSGAILFSNPALNQTVAGGGGEYTHTIKYTPNVAESTTVTVTAVISFADGTTQTYWYDISYDVTDINKLVFIGIDGSHYNEYVSGNYKDSMNNFAVLAAEQSVRTVILNTSEELIAAAKNPKYKMLILTAPSRRLYQDTTLYKSYSEAELNAFTDFAERGGTFVLAGWSNVYENYSGLSAMPLDEHMSSQQNKVLAAIGSALRLSDDAAKDPLQWSSATDTYRLYLTDGKGSYNWNSPLLAGVDRSQQFSQYGGSTIYAVDSANKGNWDAAPAATVPSGIIPTVTLSAEGVSENRETYPKETNFKTGLTTVDGKLMVMASETVVHENGKTSQVIAAGGAFMSNFEVKIEMDNASTLQYSNYNICLNLVKSIASEPVITSVADAKALPKGTKVTIEGIATSNVHNGTNTAVNTGFFDCIYMQDATSGINLFPVASGVAEGQKIRVTGTLSAYQGETQIQVSGFEVIDSAINKVLPTIVTTKQAMQSVNTGKLVKLTGVVTDVKKDGTVVNQFSIKDESGVEALIYINAYITAGVDLSFITLGATVSVTGLASIGENFSSSDYLPRIRVRDRNEIMLVAMPCTVTFNSNGGTAVAEIVNVAEGSKITAPAEPTKDGYTFGGWYKDEALTTVWNFTVDTVTANTILYAKWNAITYTVTFNSNGGTIVTAISNIAKGSKIAAPVEPIKEGYTFDGWYKDEALTTVWNFTVDTITTNTILYAKWNAITYTVTFNSNGGSTVAAISNIAKGNKIDTPAEPTKEGYAFDGWYKDEALTTVWNFTVDTVTTNTTIYAKWSAITYTVTFNSNGGTTIAAVPNVAAGSKIAAPPSPTRSGYNFKGWYKEATFVNTWSFSTDVVASSITLYARWTAVPPNNNRNENNNGGTTTPMNPEEKPVTEQPTMSEETPATEQPKTSEEKPATEQPTTSEEKPVTEQPTTSEETPAAEQKVPETINVTVETTTVVTEDGKTSVAVDAEAINAVIEQINETKGTGEQGAAAVIGIVAEAPQEATNVSVDIPKEAFESIAGTENVSLQINTGLTLITLDSKAIETVNEVGDNAINITVNTVDTTTLSEADQKKIGERPVYDFTVSNGDVSVTHFNGGKVYISIPYTPQPGENLNAIVVYYIDNDGKLNSVRCKYNPETGTVDFKVTHFSTYAIAYNPVSFTDVTADKWYFDAVGYIGAHGIVDSEDELFNPDMEITRGDYLVMLMKAYNINPDYTPGDNFDDAVGTPYEGYLAAAKRQGISQGAGNNKFNIDKTMTREEMICFVYNALDAIGEMPVLKLDNSVDSFIDADMVADWALTRMNAMIKAGVVEGDAKMLNPKGTPNRAMIAVLIYKLIGKQ